MSEALTLPVATAKGREEMHSFRVGVYGESGSGKTAWTEEVLVGKKQRLIVFDSLCKDYGNPKFCQATGIRYDGIYTNHREILQALAKKADTGSFRIVARCPEHFSTIWKAFAFSEDRQRSLVTNATLLIEEISLFMDSSGIPPELADIIVRGRHSGLNWIGVAQVPQTQTNPLYRSQLNTIISFRQTGANSIRFFSDYSEQANELRSLKLGEFRVLSGDEAALAEFREMP